MGTLKKSTLSERSKRKEVEFLEMMRSVEAGAQCLK
jgi:hypothetical protein